MSNDIVKTLPSAKSDNPTPYTSFASMSDEAKAAITTTGSLSGVGLTRHEDTLSPRERAIFDAPKSKAVQMSGTADPILAESGIAIGDRVYHRVRKLEGTVKDVAASGKVQVKYDGIAERGWALQNNLVKL